MAAIIFKVKDNKNIISLDLLRIISGVGVVFIHVSDHFILFNEYVGGLSWWIIYVLNVYSKVAAPLFMLISGYLLLSSGKIDNKKEFFSKRLKRVGIPTIAWISIFFVWQAFWEKIAITPSFVFQKIYEVNFGPLYFLVVILELYLLAPLFLYLLKRFNLLFLLSLLGLSLIGGFLPRFIDGSGYDISESIFTIWIPFALFFVSGGYIAITKIRLSKHFLLAAFLVLGVITVLLSQGEIGSGFISYSSPTLIGMSIALFMLIISFEKAFTRIPLNFKRLIAMFAGTVFGIYLTHPFIINVLNGTTRLKPGYVLSPIWVYVILISVLVTILSLVIVLLLKKSPIGKYVVG